MRSQLRSVLLSGNVHPLLQRHLKKIARTGKVMHDHYRQEANLLRLQYQHIFLHLQLVSELHDFHSSDGAPDKPYPANAGEWINCKCNG